MHKAIEAARNVDAQDDNVVPLRREDITTEHRRLALIDTYKKIREDLKAQLSSLNRTKSAAIQNVTDRAQEFVSQNNKQIEKLTAELGSLTAENKGLLQDKRDEIAKIEEQFKVDMENVNKMLAAQDAAIEALK